jgi:hypothetical protein
MFAHRTEEAPHVRYLLTPPGDTRPSLLVELCPKVDEPALRRVANAMHGLGCANALVLDQERGVLLRDTYATMGPDSIEPEPAVFETRKLLGAEADPLEQRLERWLAELSDNWHAAVPREEWTAPLLTDVVPAASGAVVRRVTMGQP